jgi:hypothetical protein
VLGLSKEPLRMAVKKATALYLRDSLDESVVVVKEARMRAPADGRGLPADEVAALAEGWEIQARVELDKGRLQQGLESFAEAERILDGLPDHSELRGRICFQVAQQIAAHSPQLQEIQVRYAALARDLLADSVKYRELREWAALMVSDALNEEREPWQDRRARLLSEAQEIEANGSRRSRRLPDRDFHRIVDLHMRAIRIGIEEGDDKAARESFIDASTLAVTVLTGDIVAFFFVAGMLSHILDRPRLSLGDSLAQVAETSMRLAAASDSDEYLSEAYLLAAIRDHQQEKVESCLANALASVWHGQRHQATDSASVLIRGATKHRLDEKRALAADIALRLENAELVAELIEGARLQALAETAQVHRIESDKDYDLGALLRVTGASLQDIQQVSVNGRSRVAEAVESHTKPKPIPLEPVIAAVGGADAVYWGSWAAIRKLYWAFRSPDGSWSAGVNDLGPGADTILAANADLRPEQELSPLAMLEDQDQELFLTRELGEMVIPPPLAEVLAASASPVSLVIAGTFVCELPLPALVIPGTSEERLIERAVIRVQPPTVLVGAMPPAVATGGDDERLTVRIACLDPSGDLPYSRNYDIPCLTLLTTPSKKKWAVEAPTWSRPATRTDLTMRLRQMKPGEPALFVYSGHVQQNGVVDGPQTSLVLADGPVSAAELAALPIPSHVLLSACSSSGAGGTGAGEWLGLAGSLLRGGARQITATSWPIPDTRFTAYFEFEVVTRMCASGDAAAALRESQLNALARWRSRRWRASEALETPFPRVWAAFQMIGVTKSK